MTKSKIFLVPCPIVEGKIQVLPPETIQILHGLQYFIVERAKTARHFIKAASHPLPIANLQIFEIDAIAFSWKSFALDALSKGHSIGIVSEAGCPGIADPGSEVVKWAHQNGVEVVPAVGPSSIFLALMASGMNGQSFTFHGYLPSKKPELVQKLRQLEQLAIKGGAQIFMETPYKNGFLLETCFQTLSNQQLLCIACDINSDTEFIKTKKIEDWKKIDVKIFHKRPCIFVLGS